MYYMGIRDWFKSFKWDEDLSLDEATDLIGHILERGRIRYLSHSLERMEVRGFTTQDVMAILEDGKVFHKEFDEENKSWKYKVKGKTVEREDAVVVSAVIDKGTLVVITIF